MRHKYAFFLVVLIAFHAINNYVWLKQDNESLSKDTASHISRIIAIREKLQDIGSSGKKIAVKSGPAASISTPGGVFWPQAFHLLAAVLSLGCKDALFCIRFSNMLYFIVLIIAVYLLGKKLSGPDTGLLAAFLVSFYPAVFGLSRKCGLDFPLIAAVCLAVYFLVESDNFKKRSASIFFGICLGLALLVKAQAFIFISGPFIYTIAMGLVVREDRKKCLLNVLFSLVLATAISMLWWSRLFLKGTLETHTYTGLISKFFWIDVPLQIHKYFATFYIYLSPVFFIVFLVGIFLCLRRVARKALSFLACWILPPAIFFSGLLPYNNQRYIFPVFGALALISAIGLMQVPGRKIRRLFIALVVCAGVAQFFLASYWGSAEPFVITSDLGQPPDKNNHQAVMQKFNRIIAADGNGRKDIAIIEEEYFRADFCLRLKYFLRLADRENNVFLSAGGFIKPRFQVSKNFLANADNYRFLIAFSKDEKNPDFAGLLLYSVGVNRGMALKAIERFKSYAVMEKAMLMPEEIYIYLLRRKD